MCHEDSSTLNPVGFLNINKPSGVSSRFVVDRVRDHLQEQTGKAIKVGHSGTLDPIANGVLVLGIGDATTLLQVLQAGRKRYRARFQLGQTSDSFDQESEVYAVALPPNLNEKLFRQQLDNFRGEIIQTPPKFSAVKVGGRRAYKMARKGHHFAIPERSVTIHQLELVEFDREHFCLDVECSGGTYIRTLGHDLALSVGTDAVMIELSRTASCGITLTDSHCLESLLDRPLTHRDLMTPLEIFKNLPCLEIPAQQHWRFANGLISHRLVQNLNQKFGLNRPTRCAPAILSHRSELAGVIYWSPGDQTDMRKSLNIRSPGRWTTLVNFVKNKYR